MPYHAKSAKNHQSFMVTMYIYLKYPFYSPICSPCPIEPIWLTFYYGLVATNPVVLLIWFIFKEELYDFIVSFLMYRMASPVKKKGGIK